MVVGVDLDKTGSIATPSWWVSTELAVDTVNEALGSLQLRRARRRGRAPRALQGPGGKFVDVERFDCLQSPECLARPQAEQSARSETRATLRHLDYVNTAIRVSEIVLSVSPLGFPWRTADPFLFCVHHDDAYPAGDERMAPTGSLAGREIGQDFAGIDGWRMYHGDLVPGFPQHPHRGFETVTIVRNGIIDHSDSLGAAARFGRGDTQWLTAGKGIVHSEMFPLLDRANPNPLELFQIWLNLPAAHKLVEPNFTMFWRDTVRTFRAPGVEAAVIAGQIAGVKAPPPPPDSWAASANSDVAIWTIKLAPGARWTLPKAAAGSNRTLYFFRGSALAVEGRAVPKSSRIEVRADAEALLVNGPETSELLLLQGRPIGEAVAQHGPFVMNTQAELKQAFSDYQRTGFGGWRWPADGPVHGRDEGRFARYPDGRIERVP